MGSIQYLKQWSVTNSGVVVRQEHGVDEEKPQIYDCIVEGMDRLIKYPLP